MKTEGVQLFSSYYTSSKPPFYLGLNYLQLTFLDPWYLNIFSK